MGFRRRGGVEIKKYLFLALGLMGLGTQGHVFSVIPREDTPLPCTQSRVSSIVRLCKYGGLNMICVPQAIQPSELIRIIKEIFGLCGWK